MFLGAQHKALDPKRMHKNYQEYRTYLLFVYTIVLDNLDSFIKKRPHSISLATYLYGRFFCGRFFRAE